MERYIENLMTTLEEVVRSLKADLNKLPNNNFSVIFELSYWWFVGKQCAPPFKTRIFLNFISKLLVKAATPCKVLFLDTLRFFFQIKDLLTGLPLSHNQFALI